MKIRSGFVSNSSTSSFIVIGFEVTREEIAKYYSCDSDDIYDHFSEEENFGTLTQEDRYLVGEVTESFEDGLDDYELEYWRLNKLTTVINAAKAFNKNLKNLKIFCGTRTC